MTLIASETDYASKATLKAKLNSPQGVRLHNPSVMDTWTKNSRDLPAGFTGTVTNGSARTRFAKIHKTNDGAWRVV